MGGTAFGVVQGVQRIASLPLAFRLCRMKLQRGSDLRSV